MALSWLCRGIFLCACRRDLVHPPDIGVQAAGDEQPDAVGEERKGRPWLKGKAPEGHEPNDSREQQNDEQAGNYELLVEKDVVPTDIQDPLRPVELHQDRPEAEGSFDIGDVDRHEAAEQQHDAGPGSTEYPARRCPGGFVEVLVPVAGDSIAHEEGTEAEGTEVEGKKKQEAKGCFHVVKTTIAPKCLS
jgi:hypothetical protein